MNNKGFTLIELIISIAIFGVVLTATYSMLNIGIQSHEMVIDSSEMQSDVRYSLETVNEKIKYATAGFAVTKDDFDPSNNILADKWNYFGLTADKKSFAHFKWNSEEEKHEVNILATAPEDIIYDITFKKATDKEDNLIEYELKGMKNDKEVFDVKTQLDALNAIQIIDWGDYHKRAIAFAYRTDETPTIDDPVIAALNMIIDKSGSMGWSIDGYDGTRMELLKETLTADDGIFKILKDSYAYVSFTPFSSSAFLGKDYISIADKYQEIINYVNGIGTGGATNTGDGLRRSYYKMKYFNENKEDYGLNSSQKIKNYLILLVDGQTNTASLEDYYWDYINNGWQFQYEFYLNDGEHNYLTQYGNSGDEYVEEVGKMIQDDLDLEISKKYIIAYAASSNESENEQLLENIKEIAEDIGIETDNSDIENNFEDNENVFVATDQDSLKDTFEKIGEYVKEDMWQVNGPKVN